MTFFESIKYDMGIPSGLTSYDDELFTKVNQILANLEGINGLHLVAKDDDGDMQEIVDDMILRTDVYHYVLTSIKLDLEPPTGPVALEEMQTKREEYLNNISKRLIEIGNEKNAAAETTE